MLTSKSKSPIRTGLAVSVLLGACVAGFAQSNNTQGYPSRNSSQTDDSYASRTRAIDERESRAEQEAERLVSLPAECYLSASPGCSCR